MDPNSTAPSSQNSSVTIPVALGVLILLVVLVGGFYFYGGGKEMLSSGLLPTAPDKGKIYLSLTERPKEQHFIGVYSFDVKSSALEPFIAPDPEHTRGNLTSAISPDGTKVAFASIFYPSNSPSLPYPVSGYPGLFIRNIDGTGLISVKLPSDVKIVRNPVWSYDGKRILFSTRKDHEGKSADPSTWFIYALDIATKKTTLITSGVSPLFTPTGQIIALRKDGLYVFNADQGIVWGERVWSVVDGGADAATKLALSPDGKLLAWPALNAKKVDFIAVSSWAPFQGAKKASFEAFALSPVFSPDGSMLAFLTPSDPNYRGPDEVEKLVGMKVADGSVSFEYLLTPYDAFAMFLTEWR